MIWNKSVKDLSNITVEEAEWLYKKQQFIMVVRSGRVVGLEKETEEKNLPDTVGA